MGMGVPGSCVINTYVRVLYNATIKNLLSATGGAGNKNSREHDDISRDIIVYATAKYLRANVYRV